MELVTVFCPLTTTIRRIVVQTAEEKRFVVDCNVNRLKPAKLVGHVKITFRLGRNNRQLRGLERKTEHRARAQAAAIFRRPIQGVAR